MISNKPQRKQRNDITQRKLKLFDYITNIIACISKAGWLLILNSSRNEPTFDDRQAAPLDLLPEAAHQPLVDFLQQLCEVVWIRLHDLVELGKLARTHTAKCQVIIQSNLVLMKILWLTDSYVMIYNINILPFRGGRTPLSVQT